MSETSLDQPKNAPRGLGCTAVVMQRKVACPSCNVIQPVESLGGYGWMFTLDDDEEPHEWWCLDCGHSAPAEAGWTAFMVAEVVRQKVLFEA